MRTVCALVAAAVISVAAYGTSNAAPIAPLPAAQTETGAITPVYYRHYHYYHYYHRPYWHPYPYRYYYWGYPRPYYPYRWGYRWWW